jgi:hypothetical protein
LPSAAPAGRFVSIGSNIDPRLICSVPDERRPRGDRN